MPKFIDYTGKKIGRVNIISLHEKIGNSKWKCICDCGTNFICWSNRFKNGSKFECNDCRNERKRGIDLTGRKFGRWTVLNRVIDHNRKTMWKCKCDCGVFGLIATDKLGKRGKSMSCGCLGRKEKSKHANTTLYPPSHGLSKSKFYAIKTGLIHKCHNEKNRSYPKFGGIGIKICDLWRNGVKDMHDWAVSAGWEEGDVFCLKQGFNEFNPETTFILKENEFRSDIALKGGYQITYNGETHSVKKWAEILNVGADAIRKKLLKFPSIDLVFESEFRKCKFTRDPSLKIKCLELFKSGMTVSEISKKLNTSTHNIRYHLKKLGIESTKQQTNSIFDN